MQYVFGIALLVGVYILTQMIVGYRIRRACTGVVKDLERLKALSPSTAVALPYAKPNLLHIGLRDFRPKAVVALMQGGFVGKVEDEKYYLIKPLGPTV